MSVNSLDTGKITNGFPDVMALFCLSFVFFTVFLGCIPLLLRTPTEASVLVYGGFAALLLAATTLKNRKAFLYGIPVCLCILAVIFGLSTLYADFSADGPWYHQLTVDALCDKKNIFFETTGTRWGDAYPKASEIFAGELTKLFPSVNAGAFLNYLLMAGVFAYCLRLGKHLCVRRPVTILCAFFFAFNPVVIQQLYTYYCDFILSACAFFIMASVILLLDRMVFFDCCVLLFSSSLAIGVKMSGVALPFVGFGVLIFVHFARERRFSCCLKQCVALGLLAAILGAGVFGFNPYVTNLAQGKHILHPFAGDEAVDFMPANEPRNFNGKSRLEKLARSLAGRTSNIYRSVGDAQLKLRPGVVFSDEKYVSGITDVRVAGWGPLFWTMLLLSLFTAFLFKLRKRLFATGLAFILLTIIIHPESWWARYAPQMYFIPVFLIFSIESVRIQKIKIFAYAFLAMIIISGSINIYIISRSKYRIVKCHDNYIKDSFRLALDGRAALCTNLFVSSKRLLFNIYNADASIFDQKECFSGNSLQRYPYLYFDRIDLQK